MRPACAGLYLPNSELLQPCRAGLPAGTGTPRTRSGAPGQLLGDDAEDLFFAHDEVLLAVHLDFLAGVLAEEDGVAFLHVERRDLAVLLDLALADRDDLALHRLFL